MNVGIATAVVIIIASYAAIGVAFAAVFVAVGVGELDHAAAGSKWPFRIMIFPGIAALWPLMLRKWIAAGKGHP